MTSDTGRFRQFVEASSDCMKELDAEGIIRFVAGLGCASLVDGDPNDIVGTPWLDLWPEDARESMAGVLRRVASGERVDFVGSRRIAARGMRWWEVMVAPVLEAGVFDRYIVISRDVTDRVELQAAIEGINEVLQERLNETVARSASQVGILAGVREQLDMAARARELADAAARQAQKQQAIGQLVSGVAHDFNNMLQTVIVSLSALEDSASELQPRQQRMLSYAIDGARHATALTRRLLAFARNQPSWPEALDVAELIPGFSDFARHGMGGRVAVDVRLPGRPLPVWLDRQGLEQALMNVCLNARDAMDGHGTIVIEASERVREAGSIDTLRDGPATRQVVISIVDTGVGMTPEVRQRVFDPYFTTKEGGSGLGLAQVYGLVAQASGSIEIDSAPGIGTCIRLVFPHGGGLAEFAE